MLNGRQQCCATAVGLGIALLGAPLAAQDPVPSQLTVANSTAWVPYSFLDAQQEPRGLLVDLWRLFGEKNDVDVTFELTDWQASLDLVQDGGADVHGGLIMSESRAEHLEFSSELVRLRTLLFVAADSDIIDLADTGDTPVGIVAGTFEEEFVGQHFPDVVLRAYPNSQDVVRAAIDGELKAFVADYPSGYYHLIALEGVDGFVSIDTLFTEGLHVGVAKGASDLLAFLERGFDKISDEEIHAIRDRWFVLSEPFPRWILAAFAGLIVIGGVLGFAAHYLSLRRAVMARTAALAASVAELEATNRKLDQLARLDQLTGLANRHHFYELVANEIARSNRYVRPLSLALFDLDDFKTINDRFGHAAGDAALKHVADAAVAMLRGNDVFARLGGDEFVAILPETSAEEAQRLARRVADDIRSTALRHDGKSIALSFSAGVATYRQNDTVEQWLEAADKELYINKSAKRVETSAGLPS